MSIEPHLAALARNGMDLLRRHDHELFSLLQKEYERQATTLSLVASSSLVDPSVLACEGSIPVNVTAEGYPGQRFHGGCEFVDEIERLAISRAKAAFKARYANVQPNSASTANEVVMFGLLQPGDTILGLKLQAGGHLTHGAKVSISGKYFNAVHYGLDADGLIDYERVSGLARKFRPKLIICGATAHPRVIDFRRFRRIADEVGAFLLADVTHTAGLIAAGLHPSPIDEAHFTTTCTHKQLYGPRGGLILMGRERDTPSPDGKTTLSGLMQRAVFPLVQGAPAPNVIAAKARALARVVSPEFLDLACRIKRSAAALAENFAARGYRVITGGTDTHIVLLDVAHLGLTGVVAERALEESGIVVNKNVIPGDRKSPTIASGIRLGTNSVAVRGMGADQMRVCADLTVEVLSAVEPRGDSEYRLADETRRSVRERVRRLCREFPIPGYPPVDGTTSSSLAAGDRAVGGEEHSSPQESCRT